MSSYIANSQLQSPSPSRRKHMVSPLDGYVQLGCSIAYALLSSPFFVH